MSFEFTASTFDAHVSFRQASEFEWAEVDVPYAIIDLFQANIFSNTGA